MKKRIFSLFAVVLTATFSLQAQAPNLYVHHEPMGSYLCNYEIIPLLSSGGGTPFAFYPLQATLPANGTHDFTALELIPYFGSPNTVEYAGAIIISSTQHTLIVNYLPRQDEQEDPNGDCKGNGFSAIYDNTYYPDTDELTIDDDI